MFKIIQESVTIGDQTIHIEMGKLARQANGSVFIQCQETQLLATAVSKFRSQDEMSFLPLSIDYIEKMYSAGRIPGGYIKRETKPTEREILTCRLIDRSLRPFFPKQFRCETQVVINVLSVDPKVPPAPLAILASSLALHASDIPFLGPIAGVQLGYKNGKFHINPSESFLEDSLLNLVVSGAGKNFHMVEAGATEVSEKLFLEGFAKASEVISELCQVQNKIQKKLKIKKYPVTETKSDLDPKITKKFQADMMKVNGTPSKLQRKEKMEDIKKSIHEAFPKESNFQINESFSRVYGSSIRKAMIDKKIRLDGRKLKEIRSIECETSLLKNTHGSALFTRGETQSLGVVTLGTTDDCQRTETISSALEEKFFMLQYNMPGFATGEPKRLGAPNRRELGHGNLAERALRPLLPDQLHFPYTIRVVSEVLESNGSSSMASICSSSMALMDAGVPLKRPVAGIAMGLILEGKKHCILSDILGDEDHFGDMDFKVAGTEKGITALQMDMKIQGIPLPTIEEAILQAKEGIQHILKKMNSTIQVSRDLSFKAPRVEFMKIPLEKIKDLIGPGGKNIKRITAETGCKIDIKDDGSVTVASLQGPAAEVAKRMVRYLTTQAQVGEIYLGLVRKITEFGAFVEIKPGVEGLVHVSQISQDRVENVWDHLKEGEEIMVKVLEIDRAGKLKLSRKEAVGLHQSSASEFFH